MEPTISPAVVFPFTYLPPGVVEAFSCCAHKLRIFQPAGAEPPEGLQPWINKGFLKLPCFSMASEAKQLLMAELKDWKGWARTHRQEDLAYLKQMRDGLAPVLPLTQALAWEIRKAGAETKEPSQEDKVFAYHLFLNLAHDFDRQSWELQEDLATVRRQRESLRAFFRIDSQGDEGSTALEEPFVDAPEDLGAFMTRNRMTAWSQLFQQEPFEADLFMTPSPAAHEALLNGVDGIIPLGPFRFPANPEGLDVFSCVAALEALLKARGMAWAREAAQKADREIRQKVAAMGRAKTSAPWIELRWDLVVGSQGKALFRRPWGTSLKTEKNGAAAGNTLVGLVGFGAEPGPC